MTGGVTPAFAGAAQLLDPAVIADHDVIERLRADPRIEVIDRIDLQIDSLRHLVPAPGPELLNASTRWAYYPWRRALVHILGPQAFRRLRLDRNRNMITAAEQEQLAGLRIGVVGLSVGHIIAHTLVAQGLCARLRLADFDDLEVSNLNRVPATVLDLGENKAAIAARRIAELDPYVDVEVISARLTADDIDEFLDGLDIVVEECDSLDVKALLRRAARARRLPVLMATSDRGLLDVERFDNEPDRPILHGLLGDTDIDRLAGLCPRDKIPHVLRIVDAAQGSARAAASMVEVGQTIATWPQVAGDVVLGATAIAEAVRRIGLGEPLRSGRIRIDVGDALDDLCDPPLPPPPAPNHESKSGPTGGTAELIAAAAARAPSGGNSQPWRIESRPDSVLIRLDPAHSSSMDVGLRGSATAIGAALFNARVAAAAHHVLGPVDLIESAADAPLTAIVHLGTGTDARLAGLYPDMLDRQTNRRRGTPVRMPKATVDAMMSAAAGEQCRLTVLTGADDIAAAARLLGEADRIRYLTPHLHAEMVSELRWPADKPDGAGIDVLSLELDPTDLATLDILCRPDVMARLAEWDGGEVLGTATRTSVTNCSALAVLTATGDSLADYARGGSALQAVWIAAQTRGLAVHPVSPAFLYARDETDFDELSPEFAPALSRLRTEFLTLAGTAADESQILILKLSDAPAASVRSLRDDDRRSHHGP